MNPHLAMIPTHLEGEHRRGAGEPNERALQRNEAQEDRLGVKKGVNMCEV